MGDTGYRMARLRVGSLLVALALLGLACRIEADRNDEPLLVACETAKDAWVASACDRIRTHDGLYRFAVSIFGVPESCGALATSEFEGARFGTFRCVWTAGHLYSLTTQPPESSIIELESNAGFLDAPRVREAVVEYVRKMGLPIDWSNPSREDGQEGWVDEFVGVPVGFNAKVRLRYSEAGDLVGVRVSMAL